MVLSAGGVVTVVMIVIVILMTFLMAMLMLRVAVILVVGISNVLNRRNTATVLMVVVMRVLGHPLCLAIGGSLGQDKVLNVGHRLGRGSVLELASLCWSLSFVALVLAWFQIGCSRHGIDSGGRSCGLFGFRLAGLWLFCRRSRILSSLFLRRRRGCKEVDTFPSLDDGSLHGHGTVDVMQLEVKSTGIADGVASCVSAPERCGCGAAVGADKALSVGLVLVEGRAACAGIGATGSVAISVSWTGSSTLAVVCFVLMCFSCRSSVVLAIGRSFGGYGSRRRGCVWVCGSGVIHVVAFISCAVDLLSSRSSFEPGGSREVSCFEV